MVDHDSGKRKGDFGDLNCWRDFRSRTPFHCLSFFFWTLSVGGRSPKKPLQSFYFMIYLVLLIFQFIYVFYDLSIYLFFVLF